MAAASENDNGMATSLTMTSPIAIQVQFFTYMAINCLYSDYLTII
ncbi:hypothetical protein MACH09_04810 [Vibrio sp. MACH09]|nr:hypothetical protein MACH09_04810 [Vibrio sp. MACH09]